VVSAFNISILELSESQFELNSVLHVVNKHEINNKQHCSLLCFEIALNENLNVLKL